MVDRLATPTVQLHHSFRATLLSTHSPGKDVETCTGIPTCRRVYGYVRFLWGLFVNHAENNFACGSDAPWNFSFVPDVFAAQDMNGDLPTFDGFPPM